MDTSRTVVVLVDNIGYECDILSGPDLFGYRSLNICHHDNERTVEMSYPGSRV
jgi:hypothetical protein